MPESAPIPVFGHPPADSPSLAAILPLNLHSHFSETLLPFKDRSLSSPATKRELSGEGAHACQPPPKPGLGAVG